MLKGVMAVVQIAMQQRSQIPVLIAVGKAGREPRSDPVAEWPSDRLADRRHHGGADQRTIALPRAPFSDTQAVV
jgi:MOSC domain-containing protein YiiM